MGSGVKMELGVVGLACAAMVSQPAMAQTGGAGASPEGSENEIVVTAQRRSERLIDVPIAITVVTADELDARGAQSLADMQYSVPGLSFVSSGPGTERTQLRGVSQFVGAPTVGTYLDELSVNPQSSGGGLNIRLYDIERIEVLRGPQPTLYGEGSIGGTIRYITANPDLNRVLVRGEGQVGFVSHGGVNYRGEGAVSVPLINDRLGLRISGVYDRRGGYIDTPVGDDQNDSRVYSVRAKLLFRPSDRAEISLLGVHQRDEQDDRAFGFADHTDSSPLPDASRGRSSIVNLVGTFDLGPVTLTSSSGYLGSRGRGDTDLTYFYTTFLGFPLVTGTRSFGAFERLSQELRIASNGSGPFSYLFGAVYTDDDNRLSPAVYDLTTVPTRPAIAASRVTSRAIAVYGELSYELGAANFTVGGRYFRDRRETFATGTSVGRATFETFNPRFNISVDTGHGQIYANVAKGFRSGGFNDPSIVPPAPASFSPEDFWSYELGARQELLGRTLVVDAAVYYSKWTNIQAVTPVGLMPIVLGITNSGRASGWGAELSFRARPSRELTVTGTFGYQGLEYTAGIATHAPGDPLDGVPEFTASVSADYRKPVSDRTTVFARADLGFTSGSQITTRNFPAQTVLTGDPAVGVMPSRTLLNLRLGADVDRFSIYLYADNLFDDYNGVFAGATILNERPIRPEPRVIGIGGGFRF